MTRLRLIVAWLASLAYWLVGGLLFGLLGLLMPLLFRPERTRRLARGLLRASFRGFVRLLALFRVVECRYEGFERLRAAPGPLILAPNHPALWDAVFVLAEAERMACVLKTSLLRNPLLVGGATAAGFIPNEPAHRMLRRCVATLRQDGRLLFFPEGTRTREAGGALNPFQGGIALLARNLAVPIWPVYVRSNSRYLGKGWPLWRLPTEAIRLRITVGEPISFPPGGDTQVFLEDLRNRHAAALAALPAP